VARKDPTCPDRGSSEPEPKMEGELVARPDGGAGVPRRCEGCEEASEMALVHPRGGKGPRPALVGRAAPTSALTFPEGTGAVRGERGREQPRNRSGMPPANRTSTEPTS
jgi:hypothetical protein